MFAFVGCPNETPQPTTPLPTPPPALVKYGELTLSGGGTIPIYKTAAVTDAQMTALVDGKNVVQRIQEGYGLLDAGQKTALVGKIDEIHIDVITTSPAYIYATKNGKKVLAFGYNTPYTGVGSLLMNIATGTVTLAN